MQLDVSIAEIQTMCHLRSPICSLYFQFLFHPPHPVLLLQVMKTYHMYHTESISAESKLKDAEKQEEKQFSKSADLNVHLLRHEDRPQRRSSVRKIEKMKEKRQAKYSENKLKCTKARNDYLLNLAATNAVVAKYYIHDVSDMIDVSMR
ncbi:unnamed protein product [Oncorhynchus mykiss]|uniref:F-BAR domain-containing protein n=1 Tax=Oncorhynchus mykiss TaxID=8022 RepID=A0A060Z4L2_ONCMY|nr:unnamed protein product [Oncorhynchus mykiss]